MIRLTKHAEEAIAVRFHCAQLDRSDSELTRFVQPDPRHPERQRSYKAIAEYGGRVLRVVHRPGGDDIVIITVHFDRGARR
jgi:hypothetical protein